MSTMIQSPPQQDSTQQAEPRYPLPQPEPLPLEWGYKLVEDEKTGQIIQAPLTMLDILYPTGEEIYVAEDHPHRWLSILLEMVLRLHLEAQGWLVFGNVYVHWHLPGVPPRAPDVTAVPAGDYPGDGESFHVGQHGPVPRFVVEITSRHKPDIDHHQKRDEYALCGVEEYLIIDRWADADGPWQLFGYRLGPGNQYVPIQPDAEGALTFDSIGLRFAGVDRETVHVFNAETGERLLVPQEIQARADAEAARAAEAEARADAEAARAADAEARLRELEAELKRLRGND